MAGIAITNSLLDQLFRELSKSGVTESTESFRTLFHLLKPGTVLVTLVAVIVGGVLADIFDRRRLLLFLLQVLLVSFLVISLVVGFKGPVILLPVLRVLAVALWALGTLVLWAIAASLVSRQSLFRLVAWVSTAVAIGRFPASVKCGDDTCLGALLKLITGSWAFFMVPLLMFLPLIAVLRRFIEVTMSTPGGNRRPASPTWSSLENRPLILGLTGLLALVSLYAMGLYTYLPIILQEHLGASTILLGTVFSLGTLIRILIYLYFAIAGWRPGWGPHLLLTASLSLLLSCAYSLVIPSYIAFAALMLTFSAIQGALGVLIYGFVLSGLPISWWGRGLGLVMAVEKLPSLYGVALGMAADAFGLQVVLVGGGVVLAGALLIGGLLPLLRPEAFRLRDPEG